MVTNIEVSRFFEPVPEFRIEALYTFTWMSGEFDSITLSKRKDRPDGINTQFDKVEDLGIDAVPDDVVGEARTQLEDYSDELAERNRAGDNL